MPSDVRQLDECREAEVVRRDWLRQFLTLRTPPQGAEALICEAVDGGQFTLTKAMDAAHPMLRDLLGLDTAFAVRRRPSPRRCITGPSAYDSGWFSSRARCKGEGLVPVGSSQRGWSAIRVMNEVQRQRSPLPLPLGEFDRG